MLRNRDVCSKEGANQLARDIEFYWRQKGSKEIKAWIEAGGKVHAKSSSKDYRYDVRTNMVNGLPTDWTKEMGV